MAGEVNALAASAPMRQQPSAARRAIHAFYHRYWRLRGLDRVLGLIPATQPSGVAEVTLWGGARLEFPGASVGLPLALWKAGVYEELKTTLISRLAAGRVFYDLGANVGYYTLIGASAGSRRTIAVEPFPESLVFLHSNIARNQLHGVTVLEMAAGSSAGTAALHDGLGFGMGSVSLTTAVSRRVVATARVAPLDAELQSNGLPDPDILKLDVEGCEGVAITGFSAAIRRSQPTVLLELNERLLRAAGTSAREVLDQLRSLGYDRFLDIGGRKPRELDLAGTSEAIAYTGQTAARVEGVLGR